MNLPFTKMQGAGNDYIYINCFEHGLSHPAQAAIQLSDRHFGIGGDGLVLILPSDVADARMRMFNLDGSEGEMAGNCVRCVAKFLYDNGITQREDLKIETASGIRHCKLYISGGKASSVCVDMGRADLSPASIPVLLDGDRVVNRPVQIADETYRITCVSVGNPHCVVFLDQIDTLDLSYIGPMFEYAPLFPARVNTEFVRVVNETTLKMRVWERGNGETLACGTGACAAVVAAVENGYCRRGEDITVKLAGGDLIVNYTDEGITLTGNVGLVFRGTVEV